MKALRIVSIVAALAIVASSVALAENTAGKPFALIVGESATVDGLTLVFVEMPGDGRCPIGVNCFWEGDASCVLQAEAEGSDRAELVIHTSNFFGRSVTYAGRTITLVKLDPYPIYEDPSPPAPESYVVTLVVTQDEITTPTEDSTWSRIKALYR